MLTSSDLNRAFLIPPWYLYRVWYPGAYDNYGNSAASEEHGKQTVYTAPPFTLRLFLKSARSPEVNLAGFFFFLFPLDIALLRLNQSEVKRRTNSFLYSFLHFSGATSATAYIWKSKKGNTHTHTHNGGLNTGGRDCNAHVGVQKCFVSTCTHLLSAHNKGNDI